MKTSEIKIRDPFIVSELGENTYYMFGTTDKCPWHGVPGEGFDCYKSKDLIDWQGPVPVFRPGAEFWAEMNFWAPEVHHYKELYYMFASFKAEHRYRGTQILVSDGIDGPYEPLTDGPVTPDDWECLDGTLFVDAGGSPWIVFCHEWFQICNGAIYAMQLTDDLKQPAGRPVFLFNASEGPWVRKGGWPGEGARHLFPTYITDGPFLYRLASGGLIMLWSSTGNSGYAMGIAKSETGLITGPWHQQPEPLWAEDGGHGMLFKTFDGRRMMTFHSPNDSPNERPVFVEIEETHDGLQLKAASK